MASSSSSDLNSACWLLSSLDLDMEMQNVEAMDTDEVVDVPDTPDRMLAAQKSNGVECVNIDSNAQLPRRIGNSYCPGEGNRDGMMNREHNRKILFRPPRKVVRSSMIEHHSNNIVDLSKDSSPSRIAQPLRRSITSKHDFPHSLRPHLMDKGKDICAPSPIRINLGKSDGGQDMREQRGHAQLLENSSPHETLRDPLARDRRKVANITNQYAFKGKGKMDDDSSSPLAHRGKGIDVTTDLHALIEKPNFASHNSIAFSRAAGRKRLVRNGCISPNNIAKANLLADRNSTHEDPVAIHAGMGKMTSNSPLLINVSDSSAEGKNFHRSKGKGVISHPGTSDEVDARTREFSSWSLNVHNERDNGRRNFVRKEAGLSEGPGGWRSTHNHSKEISLPTSNESKFSAWISDGVGHNDASEDKIDQRLMQSKRAESDYPEILDIVSSRPASSSVIPQNTAAKPIVARRHTSNTLSKRQRKQGSTSAVDLDDSDVMLLGSSRQPSTSTVTINQSSDDPSAVNPMTGGHGASSDPRETEFVDLLGNNDLDARARQLEADEVLARELQEQLYQEMPLAGISEMDANLAWMVQHDPNALTASSSRNQLSENSRSSMVPPLSRQPRSRLLHPPSVRRGTRSRAQATNRVAQLRSRIRSTAPSSLPRERSVFPLNMALDTRIDVLEALEAAFGDISDIGAASHILHFQRDFNENDYEMLLSLDDSNHQNGASAHQINSLPESAVQTENFEETCAVCLETPALGDIIRHLPCFHKFHKDCIDPWLSRKSSCPVCKSSIR